MKLRHPRLVHAQLGADLFHRDFTVVVERDHALLARGQRCQSAAHAGPHLRLLIERVRPLGLGGHQHRRQLLVVDLVRRRVRRGRLDRVDADDGLAQALFVRTDRGGEVGQ